MTKKKEEGNGLEANLDKGWVNKKCDGLYFKMPENELWSPTVYEAEMCV